MRGEAEDESSNMKQFVFILAISAVLGGTAACSSGAPTAPEPLAMFTFTGTVTSGGAGLAGVEVFLGGDAGKIAQTDDKGAFTLSGVCGKSFILSPWVEGFVFTPSDYILGPCSRNNLDFTAAPAPYDSGIGETSPDLAALDQNGHMVSLYSYRGKVVFINFSADWCGSCRAEAPELEALYKSYKDKGLQILTVLLSGSAADWASKYRLTFPVIEAEGRNISGPYQFGWLPLNVILDRTLTVRYNQAIDYNKTLFVAVIKKYL
jgi:peroxiredoxin